MRAGLATISLLAIVTAAACQRDVDSGPELGDEESLGVDELAIGGDDQLDDSFGGDGRVFAYGDQREEFQPMSVAVRDDGKLVLSGASIDQSAMLVGRVTAEGADDPTWNGGDPVHLDDVLGAEMVAGDVLTDGAKTLVTGSIRCDGGKLCPVLVRLTDSGALDTSFGTGGKVVYPRHGLQYTGYHRLARDTAGRIVAVGFGRDGDRGFLMMARFTATGAPDTAFSGDGYLNERLSSTDWVPLEAIGLAIPQGRNDLFVTVPVESRVYHVTTAGALDSEYVGTLGWLPANVTVTPSGQVFTGCHNMNDRGLCVQSLDARGRPAATFGGGIVAVAIPGVRSPVATRSVAYSVALQRLYVVGDGGFESASGFDDRNLIVIALRVDGQLDTSFHEDGKVVTNLTPNDNDLDSQAVASDLVVDGTSLVVTSANNTWGAPLLRYWVGAGGVGEPCNDGHCTLLRVCRREESNRVIVPVCRRRVLSP